MQEISTFHLDHMHTRKVNREKLGLLGFLATFQLNGLFLKPAISMRENLRKITVLISFRTYIKYLHLAAFYLLQQVGVLNGLCQHFGACEQCVYFCEREQ